MPEQFEGHFLLSRVSTNGIVDEYSVCLGTGVIMDTQQIGSATLPIVYIISQDPIIKSAQDMLDLLGEYSFSHIVLHDYNFPPAFFDLSTGYLGEVLQKLTNYQVQLAIIGDFKKYPSKVLQQFISESTIRGKYLFVSDIEQVKQYWFS